MVRIKVLTLKEILFKFSAIILSIFIMIIILKIALNVLIKDDSIIEKEILNGTLLSYDSKDKINNEINIINRELGLSIFENKNVDNNIIEFDEKLVSNDDKNENLILEKISDSKYRFGNVYINSYLKHDINPEIFYKTPTPVLQKNCSFLIYHTHTSESYSIDKSKYSDYYRTEDNAYNVVAVGNTLKEILNNYGYKVTHDETKHDYPSYNGAYKSSLKTVEKYLSQEKYDVIFDIHRDALSGNSKFRPTVEINGETVAKIMIVVGSNDAGLEHDNWIENFKFAIKIQQIGNEMYPGLFRDMHLSTSRYNQHTSDKALIIEVGATGNNIEECQKSMKYLAIILNKIIHQA